MPYRRFELKVPLRLGYGSHVREPTPKRYKTHPPGTILQLDSEAPNGNVWFLDPEGERGKIECGQVSNLNGRVVELFEPDDHEQIREGQHASL